MFGGNGEMRDIIFENLLHGKWSNFDNTQKNPTNFQECWEKMKK